MDEPLLTELTQLSASLRQVVPLLAAGQSDIEIGLAFGIPMDQARMLSLELQRLIGLDTRQECVVWAAAKLGQPVPGYTGLSTREVQVLGLVAEGMSNDDIGKTLLISDQTVKGHLRHIFTKLGVGNRHAAGAWYNVNVKGLPRPDGLNPEALAERVLHMIDQKAIVAEVVEILMKRLSKT